MKNDVIFIHVPKTGGTTINSAMQGTHWQTRPDFNYRHIMPLTKESNAGEIFNPENLDTFKMFKIFMMLRDPIDRMISEYYFIKDRKEFMDLLRTKPTNFENYILTKQTQNGVVNFLKGKRMYDSKLATAEDLKDVLFAIDNIPVHVGIFERFEESLNYFTNISGIKWNRKIEVKRMTFLRPSLSDLEPRLIELITEKNQLDVALYEHCKEKFENIQLYSTGRSIEFVKEKYNHVVPYCNKWCFFEFCLENKKFIQCNFEYFKSLTFYLIRDKKITDGKSFTQSWNESFVNTIHEQFPDSDFCRVILKAYDRSIDPLQGTINIAQSIDLFFENNKKKANQFYRPLLFKQESVRIIKQHRGLISKLFGQ